MPYLTRRRLLSRAAAAAASVATLAGVPLARASRAAEDTTDALYGQLFKTLKIGMVRVPGSLTDKFKAARAAGFEAIELSAPGANVEEARRAAAESGLPIDGTVCAQHWSVRHTDPDPEVRRQALNNLLQAIRDTDAMGGHSVLLVVGRGSDGPEAEIWPRSVENIARAVPVAARYGVSIAIENVWNQFLYDHDGGADQTAEKFARYVDEFASPWVGLQYDIGNHWKYGNTGDWIRLLGKRIVKLDVKGFSRQADRFTKIGEGDIDWADIRKALKEINFHGWCAAEVSGGGPERLAEVSANMDRVFKLQPAP